jgi:hypothetical protein
VNDGGSICIRGPAANFEDCRFVDSFGGHWGGAVAISYRFSYNFTRCVFLNCSSKNETYNGGQGYGGGVCLWGEISTSTASFIFDHCYFELNFARNYGTDVALALAKELDKLPFDSFDDSWVNHSISRTRRDGESPMLFQKQTGAVNYNNLVPYSYGEILYTGTTHKDVEYCGCIDYHCRTLEYTYGRLENQFFFLFICFYFINFFVLF